MADQFRKLLATNIRADDDGDDSELRESLRRFGWSPKFPALKDEHGVVLVGHRRLRLATELGIDPVVDVLHLGDGDEADAERVKLALISNIGSKPMTPGDRQRIAEHLYGDRQWTMQAIAKALGVSHQTIGRDLENLSIVDNSPRPKSASNPKGAGRPKGSGKPPPTYKHAPDHRRRVAEKVLDEGKSHSEVHAEEGVSDIVVRTAVAYEQGRREAKADPEIDPATLSSMSAQEKLAAAIRQAKRRLQDEFEQVVAERVREVLESAAAHDYKKLHDEYAVVLNHRDRPFMKPAEYKLILSCLHPDSRGSTSERKLSEAFGVIQKYKLLLADEATAPTPTPHHLPKTAAEWMAARRKATESRKAKRNGVMRPQ